MPEDNLPALKSILTTALTQSPLMLTQNVNLAQSAANRYGSDSPLWPTLGGSAGYGVNGGRTTSDPPSSSKSTGLSYGIGFTQSLYQWGALKAQSDIGKLAQQVTERQFADAYRGLASSLRAQFLSLIAKKIYIRNSRYDLELMQANVDAKAEQVRTGILSEADLNLPRIYLLEAHLNIDRALQDYDYAKTIFMRLAGVQDIPEESIPAQVVRPAYQAEVAQALLNSFLGGGINETFQAQIYILTLKQNDLNYQIVKTGLYYPKFSFSANYNLSTSTNFLPTGPSTTSGITYGAGINASVPLFNGFATHGAKLSALATKRSTTQQLHNYLDSASDTAQNLRKQLDLAARALAIAEDRRALAEDGVRKTTDQFNEGTMSKDGLQQVTANFNAVDYATQSVRMEFLNRWTDYVSLVGADPILGLIPANYKNLPHGK